MKMAKRVLSIMLAIITLVSVVSVSAEALKVTVGDKDYGYMVPVNNKGTKVVSSVKLYGNYDYLNFYINAEYSFETYFFYEIYSDKKLTKCVYSDCIITEEDGTYNASEKITLKGKFSSKTYYVVTYAGKYYKNSDEIIVDENSMCQFKMVVDRSPSYKEKIVALKSVSTTVNGPKITWTKISGTSKYYIYRRKITETKWTKVGSVSGTKNTFTDTKAKTKDGNYIYTVKGIGKNKTNSRYHYAGIRSLYSEAPVLSTLKVIADNVIYLKWNETSSKARYTVYRKEVGGNWKAIAKNLSGTSYKDATAVSGKNYQYTVRATRTSDYGNAVSAYYQNSDKKIKYIPAPELDDLNITEEGVVVSWELVEGATSYSVFRKPLDSDVAWTLLEEVSPETTTYVDTTASLAEGGYLYTVRSMGDGFSGSYSAGKDYLVLAQPEFEISGEGDGVHIEWEKVPYATSYRILEQNEYGNWIVKAKTQKNYYNFYPKSYYNKTLTVCACRTGGFLSTYKTDVEETVYFPEITIYLEELAEYTSISWSTTPANTYRVYRKLKDAPDAEYILCYEGTDNEYQNTDCENDIAYTYQVRGVYNNVEQYSNLHSVTHTRYTTEKYIKNFYIRKDTIASSLFKGKVVNDVDYVFVKEKTKAGQNMSEVVYYKCEGHWDQVCRKNDHILASNLDFADSPITFSYAVSDENGSTPRNGYIGKIMTETCAMPELTISPTSKGYKISWEAVENAVSYDVSVDFAKKTDYKKTIKADGSKTYSVSLTDVQYNSNTIIKVAAVHKNGNRATRRINDYRVNKAPELVKAGVVNGNIKVVWDAPYYDYDFAVLRKAEGESKWTVLSKKYYEVKDSVTINGKEYKGFVYTDKNAKKGVKYTYTVRWYNPHTKSYMSYYNTKGVSAKR